MTTFVPPPEGHVTLKPKKERALTLRHPWIFSGAIARESQAAPGTVVRVLKSDGQPLGRGCLSPSSQIRVRMLTYDDTTKVDAALFDARIKEAVALRQRLVLDDQTNCARLVFAESDGVPGFIADQYGDTVVVQCQSALAEAFKPVLVEALVKHTGARCVVERSDAEVRKLEGLLPTTGTLVGEPPVGPILVKEHGMQFFVDTQKGHKTGFYLDQRDSRATLRALARDRRVLNCFSYTGGFAIAALSGGAQSTLSVDTSQASLDLGQQNARQNGFSDERHTWLKGDCFDVLRDLDKNGDRFDAVVLDPPKFAPSAHHRDKAARGYKDLMIRGLRVLAPGGLLLTFSCSGAIDRLLFEDLLAQASLDVGRPVRLLKALGHPLDHPVLSTFPEGEYLKGILAVA